MYEIHSTHGGVPQAIKRPDASAAVAIATERADAGHEDIVIKGADGRSFTLDEFRTEAGGSAGQRDPAKRTDALQRKND